MAKKSKSPLQKIIDKQKGKERHARKKEKVAEFNKQVKDQNVIIDNGRERDMG